MSNVHYSNVSESPEAPVISKKLLIDSVIARIRACEQIAAIDCANGIGIMREPIQREDGQRTLFGILAEAMVDAGMLTTPPRTVGEVFASLPITESPVYSREMRIWALSRGPYQEGVVRMQLDALLKLA